MSHQSQCVIVAGRITNKLAKSLSHTSTQTWYCCIFLVVLEVLVAATAKQLKYCATTVKPVFTLTVFLLKDR